MNEKDKVTRDYKKEDYYSKKHNKLYFVKDSPEISDARYDQIKKELNSLEQKYPYLKSYGSVNNLVGATPSNKFQKKLSI